MKHRFSRSILAALTVTGLAGIARAEAPKAAFPVGDAPAEQPSAPESPEVAEARETFRLGSALAKEGQWLDALAAFQRSARLRPHPVTTYNVAYCERALGHFVRAHRSFAVALEPVTAPDAPKLPADLETLARSYLVEAEQRIARVTVTLSVPNMTMKVDGHSLEPLQPGNGAVQVVAAEDAATAPVLPATFDVWVDPGTHTFVVAGADGASTVSNHTFTAGSSTALQFPPALEPSAAPPAPPPVAPSPAADVTAAPSPNRTWAILAFGVGAAGLVTSGVFLGVTEKDKSTLDSNCPGKACPPSNPQTSLRSEAATFADATGVALGVGIAGVAVGTYLWLTKTPMRSNPEGDHAAFVRPWVGAGSAGLLGRF